MALAVNYIPALSAKAVILRITSSAPLQLAVLQRRVRLLEKRRRRRCPPIWVMPLWEKMPDIFLPFPTWKSVEAELPVQKLPRNTRRGLLSECTILHNMQHQKALTLRFMRADGTSWYKQYAVDTVDKSPYLAPDGSIAYNESIVKKLPPTPRRKDKI